MQERKSDKERERVRESLSERARERVGRGESDGNTHGVGRVREWESACARAIEALSPTPAPRRPPLASRAQVSMAPPKCLLCDTDATELESARLRETWSEHEGVCWAWHTNATAYWLLCLPCHRAAWPADMRCQNGNSKPWSHVQIQLSERKGAHRLARRHHHVIS